eukprot:2345092-Rhodomonas_salina.1
MPCTCVLLLTPTTDASATSSAGSPLCSSTLRLATAPVVFQYTCTSAASIASSATLPATVRCDTDNSSTSLPRSPNSSRHSETLDAPLGVDVPDHSTRRFSPPHTRQTLRKHTKCSHLHEPARHGSPPPTLPAAQYRPTGHSAQPPPYTKYAPAAHKQGLIPTVNGRLPGLPSASARVAPRSASSPHSRRQRPASNTRLPPASAIPPIFAQRAIGPHQPRRIIPRQALAVCVCCCAYFGRASMLATCLLPVSYAYADCP